MQLSSKTKSNGGAAEGTSLGAFPTPGAERHLRSVFPVPPDAVHGYRRDGFVVLRQVLDPNVIAAARPHLIEALRRCWPNRGYSGNDPQDAYSRAFVQITKVGLQDEVVRAFTHAPRIGRVAAALMGVKAVRVFCEDWLIKPAGAADTPWHQDSCVFPFDSAGTVTAWIPIQNVDETMGLLRYARGSQSFGVAPVENISDVSNAEFERIIASNRFEIVPMPPVAVGDAYFHDGLTFHSATPNASASDRYVLALHMFADGAVIREPTTPSMRHQLNDFAPGLRPGDPAVVANWPLIYSSDWEPTEA
jgi:hypothetical protein